MKCKYLIISILIVIGLTPPFPASGKTPQTERAGLAPESPFETLDIADKRQIITSVLDTIGEPILVQAAAEGKLDFLWNDEGVRHFAKATDSDIEEIKKSKDKNYKTLQEDPAIAFHIVNFARAILDRPDFKGKKIVVLGRAADLIYDALVGLTNMMPEYRDRKGDIVLFDFSLHENAFYTAAINYEKQFAEYIETINSLDKEKGVVIVDEIGGSYIYPYILQKLLFEQRHWNREKVKFALMGTRGKPARLTIDFIYAHILNSSDMSVALTVSHWLSSDIGYNSGRNYNGVRMNSAGYPATVKYTYYKGNKSLYHVRRLMLKCRIYREIVEKLTVEGLLELGDWYYAN